MYQFSALSTKCHITVGSQVTPELWVLSVELALGHLASTYNLEVASRFSVNLCTPAN